MRDAVTLMVTEGLSQTDAAQRVGMARESLSRALKRGDVIALKASIRRAWLSSQSEKARITIADLAVNAQSEDVRHKAARSLLELAGELGPGRTADRNPPTATLIQIVTRDVPQIASAQASGVIELPAWGSAPVATPAETDTLDDEG